MGWFRSAIEKVYADSKLVGVASVVVLACAVITWLVWLGYDVGDVLAWLGVGG